MSFHMGSRNISAKFEKPTQSTRLRRQMVAGRVVREGDEEAERMGTTTKRMSMTADEHGVGEGAVTEAMEPLPRALGAALLYPAPVRTASATQPM